MDIVVVKNNNTNRRKCPECGRLHRAETPWWFFLEEDLDEAVCFDCIDRHDPKLLRAILDLNKKTRTIRQQTDHEDIELDRDIARARKDFALDLDQTITFG